MTKSTLRVPREDRHQKPHKREGRQRGEDTPDNLVVIRASHEEHAAAAQQQQQSRRQKQEQGRGVGVARLIGCLQVEVRRPGKTIKVREPFISLRGLLSTLCLLFYLLTIMTFARVGAGRMRCCPSCRLTPERRGRPAGRSNTFQKINFNFPTLERLRAVLRA